MKDFIRSLGGAAAVASEVSRLSGEALKINAVYQWPYEGTIPHRWRPYVARMAHEKGVQVPAELASVDRIVNDGDSDQRAAQ